MRGAQFVRNMLSKKDSKLLTIFGALIFFFFAGIFLRAKTFFLGDIMYLFQPWWSFNAQGIQAGSLYLWDPYFSNGEPFIANPQIAFFYPATLLFYFFPFISAFKLFIFSHSFVAGFFFYLLIKKINGQKSGAILTAMIFSLGGYFLVNIEFFSLLGNLPWISLIFLFFREALRERKFYLIVLTALTIVIQFFAGYPQYLAYTLLALFIYAFLVSFRKKSLYPVGYLIVSGIFSLLFSAIHFLPILEWLTKLYQRTSVSFSLVEDWYLPIPFLIKFILPSLLGKAGPSLFVPSPFKLEHWAFQQYWLNTFYLGIGSLICVYFALILGRKKYRFWIVLLVFALICALAINPWYYLFLKFLPVFRFFLHPASFMFLAVFSLSFLAGQGFSDFFRSDLSFKKTLIKRLFLFAGIFTISGILSLAILKNKFNYSQQLWLRENFLFFLLIFLSNLSIIWLNYKKIISTASTKLLLLIILFGDLVVFGSDLNPTINSGFFHHRPGNLNFIKKNLGSQRIFFEPEAQKNRGMSGKTIEEEYSSLRDALQPNIGLPYRIPYVFAYESLSFKPYKEYLYFIRDQGFFKNRMLDLLGAKYIFSYHSLNELKLRPVRKDRIVIYENKAVLPPVFYVPAVKLIGIRDQLNYLASSEFHPEKEIVTNERTVLLYAQENRGKIKEYEIYLVEKHPNRMRYLVNVSGGGWLFFSTTNYPGWQAYLDGQETKIYSANYCFQAINLAGGGHRLDLIYRPFSFLVGMIVTLLSLFLAILFAISKLIW